MALALTEDLHALSQAVESFALRADGIAELRSDPARFAQGRPPDSWPRLVGQGLHAIHLPESAGGDGAGMDALAVVAEQLGRALYPGPFVPTAIAGAVLARADDSPAVTSALSALARGAAGAVVEGGDLAAERAEHGWTVHGGSDPALGLPGADVVLVRASADGDAVWFLWSPDRPGTLTAERGVDPGRSIGTLSLDGHAVDAGRVVTGISGTDAEWIRTTVLCAEAAGTARWALDTATSYVAEREQFGRPVGSFQAVQHKAAMMLVRSEIATAAAWDAARSGDHTDAQKRLVTAQSVVGGLASALDNALECVSLLGGIGFTWEHDAHLCWRRTISALAVAGSEELWTQRLGELALDTVRDFSFVGEQEFPRLRARVREVLDRMAALPATERSGPGWGTARGDARQAVAAEAGLVAPHYPAPYGLGAGPQEQAVIAQEFAARGISQPTTVIGEWVLPTILEHGNEEQKARFVTPTLRGGIVWCQLFSEPGAGSDLASLRTSARRADGGWVISGQKVWNSSAHEADWGVCLARTDADAPKREGITYFLVDMRSAGVDVRPLRQATGRAEFNEVFLNDVFVPDECVVSEPGRGWRLAATTLSNERLRMGGALGHGSSDRFRAVLRSGEYACDRTAALSALGRGASRETALGAMNLRGVQGRLAGRSPGAEISVAKVFNAIAQRDGSRDLLRLLGPRLAVHEHEPGSDADDHATDHIGLPAVLFGGGTIEIQLNVIATRVLGLPR